MTSKGMHPPRKGSLRKQEGRRGMERASVSSPVKVASFSCPHCCRGALRALGPRRGQTGCYCVQCPLLGSMHPHLSPRQLPHSTNSHPGASQLTLPVVPTALQIQTLAD